MIIKNLAPGKPLTQATAPSGDGAAHQMNHHQLQQPSDQPRPSVSGPERSQPSRSLPHKEAADA